jgi:RNA-directed DNA polymerase
MAGLRKTYARLRLKINESKSAVASAFGRKFLGYALWRAPRGEVRRAVAKKTLTAYTITKRNRGRSMNQVVEELRDYVPGWKAYYRLAQTPRVLRGLDEWLRHRLRTLHLKHWRHGSTVLRETMSLGASPELAARIAGNVRCWWRNGCGDLNGLLTIGYFDRLGVPRLS